MKEIQLLRKGKILVAGPKNIISILSLIFQLLNNASTDNLIVDYEWRFLGI